MAMNKGTSENIDELEVWAKKGEHLQRKAI